MSYTRRDALRLAGAGAIALAAPPAAFAALGPDASLYPADLLPWPVLQGPTDHQSASFILLVPRSLRLDVRVLDADGDSRPWRVAGRFDLPGSELSTVEIVVGGLRPGRDYALHLLEEGRGYFDRRLFRALDTGGRQLRFAAVSCMNDGFRHDAVAMWEALARENCDVVILHGDTCYSDQGNPAGDEAGYARRYAETRLALSWFRFERLVPTFAVWDDHDFGLNNGNRTFALAAFMRRLFRAFWGATENAVWRTGFGVGSKLEAFGQRFFLLDGRSFRDQPGTTDARHWGDDQLAWLTREAGRNAQPAWVITGTTLFGESPLRETVETDQPDDLRRMLCGLAPLRAPVAFITGDVHFSQIRAVDRVRLGYETFEFTSSSMHSMPNPFKVREDNIAAERWHNFMVFDVDRRDGWRMRTRCILEDNRVSFDLPLAVGRS